MREDLCVSCTRWIVEVRRILEFCGLEFEPACVEFYKTERSVRAASSEQVRQPIFREGHFQWQTL